jgi:hypothetical protein
MQWPKGKDKEQTTIYKTLHIKLKIQYHEPHLPPGWTHVFRKGKQYLPHIWYPLCSFATNSVINHECRKQWVFGTPNGAYTWSLVTQILRYLTVIFFSFLLSKVNIFFVITPSYKIRFIKSIILTFSRLHIFINDVLINADGI